MQVERQLNQLEQLQQLASAMTSATAAASSGAQQQRRQQQQQEVEQPAAGRASRTKAPPLAAAQALSPPNSQRKLLAHLSVSMRPADREVRQPGRRALGASQPPSGAGQRGHQACAQECCGGGG